MNSSPIAPPAPASAPVLELTVNNNPPQHTIPSRIKVLELPDNLRQRAEDSASSFSPDFEHRAAILRIAQVRKESHIRSKSGNHNTGWDALKVGKRQQRETMPAKAHEEKPPRPLPRLAVSAPIIVKSVLSRPVPASPLGNAWSGEHYWEPEFSQSVPGSLIVDEDEERGCVHSDPVRRAVYDSVLAEMEKCARDLKAEATQRGERIADTECDVVAAMSILEEQNMSYTSNYKMPMPKDVVSNIKAFAEAETRGLLEHSIHDCADLRNWERWAQFELSLLQCTTVLDYAQASLRIVEGRRKSADLEVSEPAYCLVYAVQILEEKIRKLKARESYIEESSDDEMVEYGKFLKSIQEELTVQEECHRTRRDVSESGLERRRLKGKAPSTLDLEAWASELKELDDKRENGGAIGNNF